MTMHIVQQWSGREAGLLRVALRMTIREFAERLGVSARTISAWESGGVAKIPRPMWQAALDTLLQRSDIGVRERFFSAICPELAAFEDAEEVTSMSRNDSNVPRRGLLLGGIAALVQASGLTPERAASNGKRLGTTDVDRIEAITTMYRSVDAQHGGGALIRDVGVFAESVSALARDGEYVTSLSSRVWAAVAGARLMAGWTAFDGGVNAEAQRHLQVAERAAARASEPVLKARIGYCQARQLQHLGHHSDALDRLEFAEQQVQSTGLPHVVSMLSGARAVSLAALGDTQETVAALTRAATEFERRQPNADHAGWMSFYDYGEVTGMTGLAYGQLARHDQQYAKTAQDWVTQAIAGHAVGMERSRMFSHVGLASALFLSGEPEQGVQVSHQVLTNAGEINSARMIDRLIELRADLHAFRELPDVSELDHRLTQLRAA